MSRRLVPGGQMELVGSRRVKQLPKNMPGPNLMIFNRWWGPVATHCALRQKGQKTFRFRRQGVQIRWRLSYGPDPLFPEKNCAIFKNKKLKIYFREQKFSKIEKNRKIEKSKKLDFNWNFSKIEIFENFRIFDFRKFSIEIQLFRFFDFFDFSNFLLSKIYF